MQNRPHSSVPYFILLAVTTGLFWTQPVLGAGWETVVKEGGVVVEKKEVEGRELPVFRGKVVIRGSIYETLTVLDDSSARTKWVHRCSESRVVKTITDFKRYIYNRTDAPWPVNDRDVVVLTNISVDVVKKHVRIAFSSKSGILPEVDGVVRIPRLEGMYFLEAKGQDHTRVTYEIDTDPGGWLPRWLVKRTTRDIPLKTLLNLQKQVDGVRNKSNGDELKSYWHERLEKETGQKVDVSSKPESAPSPDQKASASEPKQ